MPMEKVKQLQWRRVRGYHKTIVLADGIGNILVANTFSKGEIPVGAKLIVLGRNGEHRFRWWGSVFYGQR